MATLQFNAYVSDDLKSIAIRDSSLNFLDSYTLVQISVSTQIDGLWKATLTNKIINLSELVYPEIGENPTNAYIEGMLIQIPAEAIFGGAEGEDFIYDNIYSVDIAIEDSLQDIFSSSSKATFYPLSRWYKDNVVANYNYYSEDVTLMKNIITYQTWLNVIDTATTYADSATISVMLKSFKSLIDGYGLPGQ